MTEALAAAGAGAGVAERATASGERLAAVGRAALALAGVALVAHPVLRPWSDVPGDGAASA